MTQVMIHQHEREHRLGNRRRTQPDARIMTAGCDDLDRLAEAFPGSELIDESA